MTRADKIRMAWLLPLALVLSLWWLFRLNPCIDNDLGNQYRQWFPEPPASDPIPTDPDAVIIENPYGIEACDYWPTVTDHWITLLVLLFVTALVGFLAARFEQWPVRRAASVMFGGLLPVVLINYFVYLPEMLRSVDSYGYTPALIEMGVGIAVLAIGAGLSSLAAWLRLRHSR